MCLVRLVLLNEFWVVECVCVVYVEVEVESEDAEGGGHVPMYLYSVGLRNEDNG